MMRRALAQWLLGVVAWLDPEMPVLFLLDGGFTLTTSDGSEIAFDLALDETSVCGTADMLRVRGGA